MRLNACASQDFPLRAICHWTVRRRALLALAMLSTPAASAAAQDVATPPAVIEIGAHVSRVSLGLEGGVLRWFPSARIVYRPAFGDRRAAIEIAYAGAAQNRDSYDRAPGLWLASAHVRRSFTRRPQSSGPDPYLTLGVARMGLDAEEIVCVAPCLYEGPNYQDETMIVPVVGLGMLQPVTYRYSVRGDVRLYKPLRSRDDGSDNANPIFEIAFGLFARF